MDRAKSLSVRLLITLSILESKTKKRDSVPTGTELKSSCQPFRKTVLASVTLAATSKWKLEERRKKKKPLCVGRISY